MTKYWVGFFVMTSVGWISAEDLRLLDLPPEEAQQHIENTDQTLKYAPKIESNVPAVRVLGKTPTNVLEDIYLANQYHGQDGLGSYLYGYSVPDIAKTERKKAHGDLKGAYQYINGGGQEIKVQYWDDGTGFHQVDNLPEVLPKQVEDSPDVQAAKQEFFKRWHEEAERNTNPNAGTGPGVGQQGSQQPYQQVYAPASQGDQTFSGQYQQPQGSYGQSQQPSTGLSGSNQGPKYGGNQNAHTTSQSAVQAGQGVYPVGQASSGSNQFEQGGYGLTQSTQAGFHPSQNQASQGVYHPGQGGYQSGSGQEGYSAGQITSGQGGYGSAQSGLNGFHPGQNPPSSSQGGYQYGLGQGSTKDCCSGQYSSSQGNYAQNQGSNEWEYKPTEEEKGPPRGFFYNVDYPVGIIVQKQGADGVTKRESLGDIYAKSKADFNQQVKNGASPNGSSQSGYQIHA